jgi:hypothetical protein
MVSQTVLKTQNIAVRRLLFDLFGKTRRSNDIPTVSITVVLLQAVARGYVRVRETPKGLWLHLTDLGEMILQEEIMTVQCPVCRNLHEFCVDTSKFKYCLICASPLEATISAICS